MAGIVADINARVSLFEAWRSTLVTSDDILGGEPVFPDSRLSVRHVGEMLLRGAGVAEIQEDYPFLTEQDIEFARLYATAYPRIGRPHAKVAG